MLVPLFFGGGDYMGIASLVIAVISLFFGLLTRFFFWFGAMLSLIGVIFGWIGRKKGHRIATAGLVFSSLCLILNVLIVYVAWYMPV